MTGDLGQLRKARRPIQEMVLEIFFFSSVLVLLNFALKSLTVTTPMVALTNLLFVGFVLLIWTIFGMKVDNFLLSVTLRTYGKMIQRGLLSQEWAPEDS